MSQLGRRLGLAAVAGALVALSSPVAQSRRGWPLQTFTSVGPPPKRRDYYAANGAREVARRQRQIDRGILQRSNGLHITSVPANSPVFEPEAA